MQSTESSFENIRKDFPILKRTVRDNKPLVYLDNASTTQKPNQVIDAITDYYQNHNANIHRAVYALAEESTEAYETARDKIANFVNVKNRQEIIFVRGTTEAINLVAYAWGRSHVDEGDIIVTTEYEHHSNIVPWQLLTQEKRAKLEYIGMDDNGELILDDLDKYLATGKVKLVTFSLMSNVLGTITDAKKIIEKCKAAGVLTLIDGAQAVGQINVDLKELNCDAYYSSLHKWLLSPPGNGILYLDESISSNIWPTLSSYNWDNKEDKGFSLQQSGTGNPSLRIGLDASIDFFNMIGKDRWFGRVKELGKYLRDGLKKLRNVEIVSSHNEDLCAGLTTYKVEGMTGPELQKILWDKERLQPRSVGKELMRHSVHIYNQKTEIDRTFNVIKSLS